jgi:hypothetical protein
VPVYRAWKKGIGHSDAYRHAFGGPFAPVAVAWLDWHLKGKAKASKMFVGAACLLCVDHNWVVQKKQMD